MNEDLASWIYLPEYGEQAFTDSSAGQFTSAWMSFADNGDPNHNDILNWSQFTPETPVMMVFGLETYSSPRLRTLEIWNRRSD